MNGFHIFVCVLWIGTFLLLISYDGLHLPACQISVAVLLDSFLTARTEKAQEIQVLFVFMAQPFFKSCVMDLFSVKGSEWACSSKYDQERTGSLVASKLSLRLSMNFKLQALFAPWYILWIFVSSCEYFCALDFTGHFNWLCGRIRPIKSAVATLWGNSLSFVH